MSEEMRNVVLAEGAKVTHNGVDYYGPRTISLPKADAEWLAQSTINARIEAKARAAASPVRRAREDKQPDSDKDAGAAE